MELKTAQRLVEACYTDRRLLDLYKQGDLLSKAQTKHDIEHAYLVRDVALDLTEAVHTRYLDRLDEWERLVVIPLAAFLHDIGRAIDVDNHDTAGAKWASKFLRELTLQGDSETLPEWVIKRVVRIIACHRAHRYIKVEFVDYCLDIVLIADKCVGDEERVRPDRIKILKFLTALSLPAIGLRLTAIPLRKGGVHDRANFAIKKAKLGPDGGFLVLKLDIDGRVCQPKLIYELYGDRFHCCTIAAKKLGFEFELEFNGVRHQAQGSGIWEPK